MSNAFLEMFYEYSCEQPLLELLEQAVVCHAQVDSEEKSMRLTVRFAKYVPAADLEAVEDALRALYGAKLVQIHPNFPPQSLADLQPQELNRSIISQYSPAAASLAGCSWCLAEGSSTLRLLANGAEALLAYLPFAERYIFERFGVETKITIESEADCEGDALFAQTEKLRKDAMRMAPQPVFVEKESAPAMILGKKSAGKVTQMRSIMNDSNVTKAIVEGKVFAVNHRALRTGSHWIVSFDMTDFTGSVRVNARMETQAAKPVITAIKKPGMWLRVQGKIEYNTFEGDIVLTPQSIEPIAAPMREDTAQQKRVELHLHTTMSQMDALTKTEEAVETAARWGHKAIAITDHGVASSFPDALHASSKLVAGTDKPIKILYGCEGYFVNDVDDRIAVHGEASMPIDGEFVAFDLETTGLSCVHDGIIEIGAVAFRDGVAVDTFQCFVNPHRRLSSKIIELTGITDPMLQGAPDIAQALPEFLRFCAGRPLVAHNADFDIGFVTAAASRLGLAFAPTSIDTLVLAQSLLPQIGKHKLNLVADALGLAEFHHHRASDDANTCGNIYLRLAAMLKERGLENIQEINANMQKLRVGGKLRDRHARHIILLAKNQLGLRNLYRLISDSHLQYFKRTPRIPKSLLQQLREGLIIGSACEAGEFFQAVIAHKSDEELKRIAAFYDYLEIQPLCNNRFLIAKDFAKSEEELREFNRTVVRIGKEMGKPVVATGDVHFLNPEDEIYRRILLATKSFDDADRENPFYFRTTDEMLEEFAYLGEETCFEVVVKNTNLIADMCDLVRPVPRNLFAPKIENSAQELTQCVYDKMRQLYGDHPPEIVTKRVETELGDIISSKYDVIYISAQRLVRNSLEHDYLVGSRGSVGSSIVAYLSGITEVNSLPAHYRCEACKFADFAVAEGIQCGADLPDALCPQCGKPLVKDGFNIPFETFLGFGGDKVPDIDLNFSGEYQARAHAYCVEMFGASHVFRAGTIGTVAEKTAYGFVKKFLAERDLEVSRAEENRLALGCVAVRRTTGQHPGGLVVIPQENEIWDFCPVQHPADDTGTETITTHFEYHSMEENLLKLDMLGHDDPTMLHMMWEETGIDVQKIPLDDADTMSIFVSSKVLGYENDALLGPTGATGIPEFGTSFVRGMLVDTKPDRFDTLIRLSGFSHGTDVWLGNAKDLILEGTASVSQAIGCRDDIMLYLISKGLPETLSFKIMESVRKGRGLPGDSEQKMREAGVPQWYITSCKKIQYLFPKAHAAAYVMMAFRIAWFKVHRPIVFYAAHFYRRSQKGNFDAAMMTHGMETVMQSIKAIKANPDSSKKDEDLLTTLEVCYEFYLRGFDFENIDLYESHATKFLIKEGKLLPPFISVAGLGETAAWDMYHNFKGRNFISIEDAAACAKLSSANIEALRYAGAFGDLPASSQMSLF
ncbi:MAG: PolC-type DNA polymerase III [Oscillospiraceae bacterium]|jgi:DNA polymerase-3 subunit alpha (Gram-positive type)|nr:PolC-type DNA polymerase III [Oscillospiraceae bacterium]